MHYNSSTIFKLFTPFSGLKLTLEPQIGIRDEDFMKRWRSRMDDCSKLLIHDSIVFSEVRVREMKLDANVAEGRSK